MIMNLSISLFGIFCCLEGFIYGYYLVSILLISHICDLVSELMLENSQSLFPNIVLLPHPSSPPGISVTCA